MHVLVFGAGVIGRIYAARLALAGNDVSLVARGAAASELASGVAIRLDGQRTVRTADVRIVTDVRDADEVDVAFLAVRRDQIEAGATEIALIRSRIIVSLIDLPLGLDDLRRRVGPERFVAAFPGVGGSVNQDGVVDFIDVRQQPTTVETSTLSGEVVGLLEAAGLRTVVVDDMTAWLQTHVVFVAAFERAIVEARGDLDSLASDYSGVRRIVVTVRRDLTALARRGGRVSPRALKIIFLRMPIWFATRYWMRQLAGPLGRIGFLPHAMKSEHTELPALLSDVRALTGA
jgi:2-dehydropantoate 2-reductase